MFLFALLTVTYIQVDVAVLCTVNESDLIKVRLTRLMFVVDTGNSQWMVAWRSYIVCVCAHVCMCVCV